MMKLSYIPFHSVFMLLMERLSAIAGRPKTAWPWRPRLVMADEIYVAFM